MICTLLYHVCTSLGPCMAGGFDADAQGYIKTNAIHDTAACSCIYMFISPNGLRILFHVQFACMRGPLKPHIALILSYLHTYIYGRNYR
jgi:hypothetical protein